MKTSNPHEAARKLRRGLGLTMPQMGALLGCSGDMVASVEYGRRSPGIGLALAYERESLRHGEKPIRVQDWVAWRSAPAAAGESVEH